ncbi:MAG: metallophosphoesterase [Geminicoccaceae bacterium]|nr:metallophosphoesterase [Geminicoccaceae bacterium]MCX8099893.1 metallophosphoesterase [Geminicoccaceae bacterium]MDW8368933.1 metallophosphoesterase [Geminicoccaceae bacterium]
MIDSLFLGAAGALAAGAWAAVIEPRRLVAVRYEIRSHAWSGARPALRLAVLGDLHAALPHVSEARLARIVERVLAEDPELVLLPGDFLANRTAFVRPLPVEAIARALAPLAEAAPTVAVLGNHDWHRGRGRTVRLALEAVGIAVLENEVLELRLAGGPVQLAGLGCPASRRADLPAVLARLEPHRPTILLTHVPDAVAYVPDHVLLTVAGHTHGGQIVLPRIGPVFTESALPRRFARGLHRVGRRHLLVTSGIGTSFLPVRFGVPPEYVIATIRAAADHASPPSVRRETPVTV